MQSLYPPINQGKALHGVSYNPINQCKAFFIPLTRTKPYMVEPIIPLTNAKVCVIPLTSARKPYMVEPLPGVFLSLCIGKIGFVLVHLHQFLHTCTGTQGKTKPLQHCLAICLHRFKPIKLCQVFTTTYFSVSVPPHVTTGAHKRSQSFCQKCRWKVTAKHTYTLRTVSYTHLTLPTKVNV